MPLQDPCGYRPTSRLRLYTRLVALGSSSPSLFDKVLQDGQALINFELTSLSLSKPPTAATAKLSGSKDPIRFKDRFFRSEDLMVP